MRELTNAELEAVAGGEVTPDYGVHIRDFIASLLDQGGGQAVADHFKHGTGM